MLKGIETLTRLMATTSIRHAAPAVTILNQHTSSLTHQRNLFTQTLNRPAPSLSTTTPMSFLKREFSTLPVQNKAAHKREPIKAFDFAEVIDILKTQYSNDGDDSATTLDVSAPLAELIQYAVESKADTSWEIDAKIARKDDKLVFEVRGTKEQKFAFRKKMLLAMNDLHTQIKYITNCNVESFKLVKDSTCSETEGFFLAYQLPARTIGLLKAIIDKGAYASDISIKPVRFDWEQPKYTRTDPHSSVTWQKYTATNHLLCSKNATSLLNFKAEIQSYVTDLIGNKTALSVEPMFKANPKPISVDRDLILIKSKSIDLFMRFASSRFLNCGADGQFKFGEYFKFSATKQQDILELSFAGTAQDLSKKLSALKTDLINTLSEVLENSSPHQARVLMQTFESEYIDSIKNKANAARKETVAGELVEAFKLELLTYVHDHFVDNVNTSVERNKMKR